MTDKPKLFWNIFSSKMHTTHTHNTHTQHTHTHTPRDRQTANERQLYA